MGTVCSGKGASTCTSVVQMCAYVMHGTSIYLHNVNASSKHGTLVTHPTLHPPEMGIGSIMCFRRIEFLQFSGISLKGVHKF